ncbi:peptidoglycan-binding protein [Nocardia sp. NPDC127579]|uniref:peptidoglycan-binding domain-containing protein n=1 Tax=Nocardia sp. NPDC127579 TaxID=3345402 RepID=UPI003625F3BA
MTHVERRNTMGKLRTRAALSAAAVILAGVGTGVLTAAPANAASTCSGTYKHEDRSGRIATMPSTGSYGCMMRNGDSSDAVKALQMALRHCYGQNISVDGQFGPRTESALKYAQREAGASADGIYGPDTRSKIKWPYWAEAVPTCHKYGV